MPSLSVGDLTPSLNVNTEPENNSDTSRGSHIRTQGVDLQEILGIPLVERLTLSRDRRIMSENMSIG